MIIETESQALTLTLSRCAGEGTPAVRFLEFPLPRSGRGLG